VNLSPNFAKTGTQIIVDAPNQSQTQTWMNSREAAKYLGCAKPYAFKTLERYARQNKMPAHFRMNRWYFLKEELDAWIKDGVCFSSQSVRVN
jgi:excisionase family DNA binding protein